MRWTPENEDLVTIPLHNTLQLWRTIFETQTLNLDLDKIAEGWREFIISRPLYEHKSKNNKL